MNKFTFTCEEGQGLITNYGRNGKITTEFRANELDVLLEQFELFLRGCGFVFDGHLDVVSNDE